MQSYHRAVNKITQLTIYTKKINTHHRHTDFFACSSQSVCFWDLAWCWLGPYSSQPALLSSSCAPNCRRNMKRRSSFPSSETTLLSGMASRPISFLTVVALRTCGFLRVYVNCLDLCTFSSSLLLGRRTVSEKWYNDVKYSHKKWWLFFFMYFMFAYRVEMCSLMFCPIWAVWEAFRTARKLTEVWSFSSMAPLVYF